MKRLGQVRIVRQIVPPPRGPVTLRQVVPLAGFLLVYAAVCVVLDRTSRVMFVRPGMFGLMAVSVWVWWMYVAGYCGLPRRRATIAFLVRMLLVGVFAFALAEPRAVRTSDTLSVVYAIDLSDSIGEGSTDAALQFLAQTVTQKPEKDQAGLVVFGRNAAAELPPRQAFPFDSASVSINSRVDRDATNIEQALSPRRRDAAGGQPGADRAHLRRHGDGREPGPHPRRAQGAGHRRRRLADPVRLHARSLARTARPAAVREDRRELRGGDRALQPAARLGAARRPRAGAGDLGAEGRLPGGQEPLHRSDQAARTGLLRVFGHDRNAPRHRPSQAEQHGPQLPLREGRRTRARRDRPARGTSATGRAWRPRFAPRSGWSTCKAPTICRATRCR